MTRERIRQLQNIALKKLRRALQKKEDPRPKPLKGKGKKGAEVAAEVDVSEDLEDTEVEEEVEDVG